MRRILPFLLMLVIALQASWSAAASVCRHEAREAAHFGHHVHADDGAEAATGLLAAHAATSGESATSATSATSAAPATVAMAASAEFSAPAELHASQVPQVPHLDCVGCHGGLCAALLGAVPAPTALPVTGGGSTPYLRAVTDGLPERLIRPPHPFLA